MPLGSYFGSPIYLNGGIPKSQKLLGELTITYFKSATKSDMNCPINVVSYAQIALKKLIFQT